MPADLGIAQNVAIDKAVEEALGHLDLKGLFDGKLVAIKPNDTWASPTDRTGVTQPDSLQALIRFV